MQFDIYITPRRRWSSSRASKVRRQAMSSTEDGDAFTLYFTTPGDPHPGEPSVSNHHTLVDALAEAWINDSAGGLSMKITHRGEVVFTEEAMQRAFGRLRTLE